jgi:AcrR family transcriptional regulator
MPRKYNLGNRRAMVEETRLRIVDAALQLHTTKGPARTSMQDIARLADVSLVTVYRHFPGLDQLFWACKTRFFEKFPPPGPGLLDGCGGLDERVSATITALYRYYDIVGDGLWSAQRDAEVLPEFGAVLEEGMSQIVSLARQALAPMPPQGERYRRGLAALLVAIDVGSWRNLVRSQGLSGAEASELMTELVLCAAGGSVQA